MDAFQCDSKRSGWQGLTALRGTALGTSAAPVITATRVAATAAAAMVAVFATVTARFARRLTAGRSVTRAALVAVEMTAASAAAAAAVILALAAEFPFAAGVGLGLWRFGGRTAEELLHPAEQTAGFFWRLSLGRRGKFGPARLTAGGATRLIPRRAGLGGTVIPAFTLRAEGGSFAAAVFATRTLTSGRDVGGVTLLTAGVAGYAAEGIALPAVLDTLGRFGREDFQLRFRFRFGGCCRTGLMAARRGLGGWSHGGGGGFGGRGGRSRDW